MSILIAMTQTEFLVFAEESVPVYAAEKVASGQWKETDAFALARKSFEESLPLGLETPDNHLFTVRDEAAQVSVGMIWIAVQERADKRIAYLYQVNIKSAHQRNGHATRALRALESEVRTLGLSGIALHVFGHNTAAHALYVKLGYLPTNINMYKSIEAAGARVFHRAR